MNSGAIQAPSTILFVRKGERKYGDSDDAPVGANTILFERERDGQYECDNS